ncbi:MAG: 16S rRNA (uracil(1498)-N(3))-methyltransferase, partial [Erysipelotrichaceae bacterium]|nr:16S rRNA (uracil(1498)-N(3))-methyltransferase [Erysipelotrichaceae bacterium]
MKQVFVQEPLSLNTSVLLDEKQAHHLFDVLRTTSRETVRVVSQGEVFLAHPEQKPQLYIFGREEVRPRMVDVTLCAALIKADKWEWMLQKAAELGVSRIVPFTCRNTVVAIDQKKMEKKMARWQAILEAAAKQCNRADQVLLEPVQIISSLKEFKSKCNLVCYSKEDASRHIANYLQLMPDSVTIAIGPEGGFTEAEVEELEEEGFFACSLGDLILRAETAACYALSVIEYQSHL